ncbi:signal transduction histidine kinase [Kitasatospora sp. MAA4]|uniref:sensor histidine kinase n=1 Tax=Kitasatospora sp. MAA4 TaxID=3035093 RepID=UPI002474E966|nr:histidine kinase [Kitasatospora sp. MAA4]MDH6136763.1 signal transduction histidine kinase [Kitasatospora sp. MAA4]
MRDALAVLIGLFAAVVEEIQSHQAVPAWLVAGLLAVGSAALWWRRSRPVHVAVMAVALAAIPGVDWPLVVALPTLTLRRRDRLSWILVALALLAEGVRGVGARPLVAIPDAILAAAPWVLLVAFVGAYLGTRRDLLAGLRARAEQAEAEKEFRADQSRLAERTRIAREMHDVLAHRVSLIALHAGGLAMTARPEAEQVHRTAELIRGTARQAMEELREVLGVLRDPHVAAGAGGELLSPQPRLADLAELVQSSREAGLPVSLTGPLDPSAQVPEAMGRAAYRVAQEALTNIHKHAPGAAAEVRLSGGPGRRLTVEVVNSPSRSAAPILPGSGAGLVGLRERVLLADGDFAAGPVAGGGFRVCAGFPWPAGPVSQLSLAEGAA